jgi:hypothetical protein
MAYRSGARLRYRKTPHDEFLWESLTLCVIRLNYQHIRLTTVKSRKLKWDECRPFLCRLTIRRHKTSIYAPKWTQNKSFELLEFLKKATRYTNHDCISLHSGLYDNSLTVAFYGTHRNTNNASETNTVIYKKANRVLQSNGYQDDLQSHIPRRFCAEERSSGKQWTGLLPGSVPGIVVWSFVTSYDTNSS